MKKIFNWIKTHIPRWLDLSHDQPWDISSIKDLKDKTRQEKKKDI
tara:strand:- start:2159 stop:2293 length:135 start_codon:yes stop_codon:yes gene_type:complete